MGNSPTISPNSPHPEQGLSHAEAEARQQIQRRALARRIAQHQDAVVIVRLCLHRREGIDLIIPVLKGHLRRHQLIRAVKIRLDHQRPAHNALRQRTFNRHRTGTLQRGQHLGNHTCALRRIEAECSLSVPAAFQHHADKPALILRQPEHVAFAEHKTAVRIQRPHGLGHLGAHFDLSSASGYAKEQLRLTIKYARHMHNFLAEGDLERPCHQQLHQPRHKTGRNRQKLRLKSRLYERSFQLTDVCRILKQANDLRINARKAHPLRLKHKSPAEGHRLLVGKRLEEPVVGELHALHEGIFLVLGLFKGEGEVGFALPAFWFDGENYTDISFTENTLSGSTSAPVYTGCKNVKVE